MGVLFCAIFEISIVTWKIDGWKTFFHGFVLVFNQFHQDLAQQILMESAFGESFHAIKHQQLCISDFTDATIVLDGYPGTVGSSLHQQTNWPWLCCDVCDGFHLGFVVDSLLFLDRWVAGFVDVVGLCGLETLWLWVVGMFWVFSWVVAFSLQLGPRVHRFELSK